MTQPLSNISRNRIVRVPDKLSLPDVTPLSKLVLHEHGQREVYRKAAASSVASIRRCCDRMASDPDLVREYPSLMDELSWGDNHSFNVSSAFDKAAREFRTCLKLVPEVRRIIQSSPDEFVAFVRLLHRRLGTGADTLRTKSVGIGPNRDGARTIFPDHRLCASLLHVLHDFIASNFDRYPGICAMTAYAGVCHAHPFSDGNGRTARALSNLILMAAGPAHHFVPIGPLAQFSRGGWIIKLRRAFLGGDWEALQRAFSDAMRISICLQGKV